MAGSLINNNTLQQWQHLFEAHNPRCGEAHEHFHQLMRLGLPDQKHEDWKYTPLKAVLNNQFIFPEQAQISAQQCQDLSLSLDAWRLVFIDGRFIPSLSDDLSESGYQLSVNNHRAGLPVAIQPEIFLHLTESLAHSVSHIQVARNLRPERPLLLLHIGTGSADDPMNTVHYRHHLSLQQGAAATIIEHFVSLDERRHFTGARFTMQVADNARLEHYKLAFENRQSYHFSHNDLLVSQDAAVSSSSFLLGGAVSRHNTSCQLNGENIDLRMNSMTLPMNDEVCDTRTWLEHNKGYCFSRQIHKIIAQDRARAVFNGQINVAPHAIKTDGQMTNNNLLLGRLAEVDSRPQLEIYADDVKCSHGATIGRIDDEQLFYLRARGIDQQAAQQMIIYAFAAELTEQISDQMLKQQVLARIGHRLGRGAA